MTEFKIGISYRSDTPPNFEEVKARVKFALAPLCGVVELEMGTHYGATIMTWIAPFTVRTESNPSVEAIKAALEGLHVIEVDMN